MRGIESKSETKWRLGKCRKRRVVVYDGNAIGKLLLRVLLV